MKVYEVSFKYGVGTFRYSGEWFIQADSLLNAAEKAAKKIKRSPRRYEDHEIVRVSLVGDLVK
jgi:hypothetical protein